MDLQLAGKRAFVTGSTQGIGRAIAEALLAEGADVVVHGRDAERVERTVADLASVAGRSRVSGLVADVADPDQVRRLLDQVGEVDVLVNNVGRFGVESFLEASDQVWQDYLDVNLMSGVRLSRHLLPAMLERGWGRILFVSSESGVDVPPDMTAYGVTKAAQIALSNSMAKLTRGTEVTVNTILGGPVFSEGVAVSIAGMAEADGLDPERLKADVITGRSTSLLGRFIEPAEIASLAVYLVSGRAAATNGAAVRADGGVLTTML